MARTVCTYGGLNLNDGVNYFLQPGFDPGEREKTFDVGRGFGGGVLQFNVTEANLIAMAVPLRVQGADAAGLKALVDAINALVDAGAQALVHGSTSYACMHSQRVGYPRDDVALTTYAAFVVFAPVRSP